MNFGEDSGTLASQHIRDMITEGKIIIPNADLSRNSDGNFISADIEQRVQPASFEPTVAGFVYVLEPESGTFTPEGGRIIDAISSMPTQRARKVNIEGGYELKRGYTYLLPLNESLILKEGEYVRSSPKSSIGRLFLDLRMVSDFSRSYNTVPGRVHNVEVSMFLLVQPLAFNVIVHPNQVLNQLRFFRGLDCELTNSEISALLNESLRPIAMLKGETMFTQRPLHEGLFLHYGLVPDALGFVAYRALRNPDPIDLGKPAESYERSAYFEGLKDSEDLRFLPGENYIMRTAEMLDIPPEHNAELEFESVSAVRGHKHYAGFIDPGFHGDLVAEFTPSEKHIIKLSHGLVLSRVKVYRMLEKPDKIYGKKIGSNYQSQVGARVAKYFYEDQKQEPVKVINKSII